ncbi:MAG: sulfite exporter TauE/SafE family protein [Bacillota bacterium]
MTESLELILFVVIIFLCFTIQGITGFGASILAVPFLAVFMDLKDVVVIVSLVSMEIAVLMTLISFRQVNVKEFLKITTCVLLGLPFGVYLINALSNSYLETILAVVIFVLGIYNLSDLYLKKEQQKEIVKPKKFDIGGCACLFCGGIIHGVFAAGGPLVVVYGANKFETKEIMRASFSALWVVINTVMLAINISNGKITTATVTKAVWAFPAVVLSIFVGKWISTKISQKTFLTIIYVVLIFAGVFMFV